MKILFNDVMQKSNAPRPLKSPALADTCTFDGNALTVNFNKPVIIDCIGIGNCTAPEITVTAQSLLDGGNAARDIAGITVDGGALSPAYAIDGNNETETVFTVNYTADGLYLLRKKIIASAVKIIARNGAAIGRLALGKAVNIPTAVAKEPGYYSTAEPRRTLSGQVIPGLGGYHYRVVSLDSRYKIGREAMEEIAAGYKTTGAGFPFFIDLTEESYKLPFNKLYATEKNQRSMSFEGGIAQYLYSRRFYFEEAF